MKLLYAIAFALFALAHVTASAQSASLLLPALCSDASYEDAGEVLTIETILARYGIIITGRTNDEIIAFYLSPTGFKADYHCARLRVNP